jgi:Rod binding domain-containing protein
MSFPPIRPADGPGPPAAPPAAQARDAQDARDARDALRDAAVALEARFLSEILRHAGFGEGRGTLGGGAGEAQFASLLRDEQARALAGQGGIGLAESLFEALVRREDDAGA